MEIGLITAVVLMAFALVQGEAPAGIILVELAGLLAFRLATLVVASICSYLASHPATAA